ncbi:hypothetical protein [Sphingomonas sp. SAFR-052]|uniref:hypothetical protein n=1 Tax=Sphingomonas sp. SAFR-052 TaxID=3436867 RepID=UPI003F818AA9
MLLALDRRMKETESEKLKARVLSMMANLGKGVPSVRPGVERTTDDDASPGKGRSDDDGLFMALMHEPYSDAAKAFVGKLVAGFQQSNRGAKGPAQRALGIIVADLMRAANESPDAYLYRSIGATTFADGVVRYGPFKKAYRALVEQGMLTVEPGRMDFAIGFKGKATRFHPTKAFFDLAKAYGIDGSDFQAHFRHAPLCSDIGHLIQLRASTKRRPGVFGHKIVGKKMKVDHENPKVTAFARQVDEINAVIASATISAVHISFRRIFNQGDLAGVDYDRGGRLFSIGGGYQQLSGDERSKMTIDGERVVELDISSSHLTIAMARLGLPVPATGDLYAVPGVPRAIVKLYVNASLGNGKPLGNWPSDAIKDYARDGTKAKPNRLKDGVLAEGGAYTGKLGSDWPIKLMKKSVLPYFPALDKIGSEGINWGILQFEESQAVVDAVHELCTVHGVVALPVHDSIICKQSDAAIAYDVLSRCFERRIGVKPKLKSK